MPELFEQNRYPRDVMHPHTGDVKYVGNDEELKKARDAGYEDRRIGVQFPKYVNVGAVTGEKDAEGRSLKVRVANAEEEAIVLRDAKALKVQMDADAKKAAEAAQSEATKAAEAHQAQQVLATQAIQNLVAEAVKQTTKK